jgi:DNA-binding CsgD family transcriptional regulator
MSKGIFIIDAGGQVTWTNWIGANSANTGTDTEKHSKSNAGDAGLTVVRGRIATVTPADQKALNGALAQALSPTGNPQPLTIIIKGADGTKRQIIHVVPMRRAQPKAAAKADAPKLEAVAETTADGAMVFVVDPEQCVEAAPALLQEHLGLTPSESRVASLIAAGDRPRDIATKLGLTEDSARMILKRVFAKTGVSRQSELVTLVSQLTTMPMR